MICFSEINVNKLTQQDKLSLVTNFETANILVFKHQNMSQDQLVDFASIFGKIAQPLRSSEIVDSLPLPSKNSQVSTLSNMDSNGTLTNECYVWTAYDEQPRKTNSIFLWHSDKSYQLNPARYTMLYGVEVPETHGETQIIDTTKCYNDLPVEIAMEFDDLFVVHDYAYMRDKLNEPKLTKEERLRMPPVIHPLINSKKHTQVKSIYFGMYCSEILYKPHNDSEKIKDFIYEFCSQEKYIYSHNWDKGDILIWNNLHTMHRACNNYHYSSQKRILDRITIF